MTNGRNIFDIGPGTGLDPLRRDDQKVEWIESSFSPAPEHPRYVRSSTGINAPRRLLYAIFLVFLLLAARVAFLQVVKGAEYRLAAEENRIRIQELKAPRGTIYDRHGTVVARNIADFTVTLVPADFPTDPTRRREILETVATTTGTPIEALMETAHALEQNYSYIPIPLLEQVPHDEALLLTIQSTQLPGIVVSAHAVRDYPYPWLLAHVVGYTGKVTEDDLQATREYARDDWLGKSGLEAYYETALRGTHGKKEVEVNSLGKERRIISKREPRAGNNLMLTVDLGLQETLYTAIEDTVTAVRAPSGGAAVAMDPASGEILALVSWPSFNPNEFQRGLTLDAYTQFLTDQRKPLFNRPVGGEYPSGSTIKPLIAFSALEEKLVTPATSFLSSGGIRINQWFFPDWKAGGHGQTNVAKALAESVNTYFYMIGGGDGSFTGLGVERIHEYLTAFGLGSPTGIDVPGEVDGFVPTQEWKETVKNEPWYIGDTYHLSIGQGDLLVTPLQVATYTATVAMNGLIPTPHLVQRVTSPDGQDSTTITPDHGSAFVDSSSYAAVREGLRQAVLSGSARALGDLPVPVAAKTGTAQYGTEGKTHSWLTAYAPYDDPKIVVTVIVEGGGEGTEAALPIAKRGLSYWFSQQ